jgi:hypothetical protein
MNRRLFPLSEILFNKLFFVGVFSIKRIDYDFKEGFIGSLLGSLGFVDQLRLVPL